MLAFREEKLRATDEMTDEENKSIVKSVVDPKPGLLADDEIDFQDINFSPNTTDNTYKLPPKVQKHLGEMVIDATEPKIEQDLYIDNDLDSFIFADNSENNDDFMVIDVKPKNEQIKREVVSDDDDKTKKFHISPPEDYIHIEKSLNTMIIEISSGSEDEVTYVKTTPSHLRGRLRRKLNKEDKKKKEKREVIVVGDNDDEDNEVDFVREIPSHPRDRLWRKIRN